METIEKVVLDLNRFTPAASRVFAGESRGTAVRQAFGLDRYDADKDKIVEVLVPEDVFTLTSSFFLGLFGPSIKKLGEAAFREKYFFTGRNIRRVMDDSLAEVLMDDSADA